MTTPDPGPVPADPTPEGETKDGCGCMYDAHGRRFRSRCICPPPMTSAQRLRAVAGLGGAIGDDVAELLAERDALRAELASATARFAAEQAAYVARVEDAAELKVALIRTVNVELRRRDDERERALAEARAENERLRVENRRLREDAWARKVGPAWLHESNAQCEGTERELTKLRAELTELRRQAADEESREGQEMRLDEPPGDIGRGTQGACCWKRANGSHAAHCPQSCWDCGGDVDGPVRCTCSSAEEAEVKRDA